MMPAASSATDHVDIPTADPERCNQLSVFSQCCMFGETYSLDLSTMCCSAGSRE